MSVPGPHDVGGRRGYGPIEIDPGQPVYHAPWEGRVIGATLGSIGKGLFPVDRWRARQEELHPIVYVEMPYFERWLYTLERNLVLHGVLDEEEIEQRLQDLAADPESPLPDRDDPEFAAAIDGLIAHGAPIAQEVPEPPRYAAGDRVRLRTIPVEHPGEQHTRLPAYAQGKVGVVESRHIGQALPDLMVEKVEARPEHTYAVRLAATDLWPDGDPTASVCVDAWESYLEPAP
jgi:nitrile hydratase beta subunit